MGVLISAMVLVVLFAGCGEDSNSREDSLREVDQWPLSAAYANDVAAARRLIEAAADVNAKNESEQSACLISTSEVGNDPRLLELTLDGAADVSGKDSYNGTGLIRAAEPGHATIVRRLLETDLDVDHVNRLGWTAVLEAVILRGGRAGAPRHV